VHAPSALVAESQAAAAIATARIAAFGLALISTSLVSRFASDHRPARRLRTVQDSFVDNDPMKKNFASDPADEVPGDAGSLRNYCTTPRAVHAPCRR
jgi:hypothetical protein